MPLTYPNLDLKVLTHFRSTVLTLIMVHFKTWLYFGNRCGDQCPVFTRDDIIRYTEPKLGYTRESAAFQKFVNVLVNFNGTERKAFLQFTTGCSSLPPGDNLQHNLLLKKLSSKLTLLPGGLANLSPRLTIVRKIDAGDGSYPSVNTCVHYLKLPDYSTEEVMKERLLTATREKGFHLN